jgi:predicted ester cyclase
VSIEENKKAARRFNEEPWNESKFDVLDELTAPSYRLNGSDGIEALKENIPEYRRACPDMRLTVEELVAEGDAVVVRWTLTGTHLGEYDGIAPTNKAIKTTGITIYHFANGKIVDDRYESSGLSLHDQLLGRLVDQPPM